MCQEVFLGGAAVEDDKTMPLPVLPGLVRELQAPFHAHDGGIRNGDLSPAVPLSGHCHITADAQFSKAKSICVGLANYCHPSFTDTHTR